MIIFRRVFFIMGLLYVYRALTFRHSTINSTPNQIFYSISSKKFLSKKVLERKVSVYWGVLFCSVTVLPNSNTEYKCDQKYNGTLPMQGKYLLTYMQKPIIPLITACRIYVLLCYLKYCTWWSLGLDIPTVLTVWTFIVQRLHWVQILIRNPDKSLKSFPPCYSQSPLQLCLEISIPSNSRNLFQFLQFSLKWERRKTW